MPIKNSDYNPSITVEGIVDTGIIVIAHFNNPIQLDMLAFLKEIFLGKRRILIPLTTFMGAYHILTQYLQVDRYNAKIALNETLSLNSPYFYEDVGKSTVFRAIDYAAVNIIESWDAYLMILAKQFNTANIYTIDQKLKKLRDFSIINPVSETKFQEYHQFIRKIFQQA